MNPMDPKNILNKAPSTRYRGSKRRILPWIHENIKHLEFDSVLDGFGGTASVSYLFKMMGKEVTVNDILNSNHQTGISFIENNKFILNDKDIEFLLHENGFNYPTLIQDTFSDIYYLDHENKWLDVIIHNISMLSEHYKGEILRKKRALAYHALFQACLSKRPYNLFHRKNLYMRTSNTERSFHNKTTWDTPFDKLFIKFSQETSRKVFTNYRSNKSLCKNIIDIRAKTYDLVYLDPPYINPINKTNVDYHGFYHFLEGITNYEDWADNIDHEKKNKPLVRNTPLWNKQKVEQNLDEVFDKFQDSIIVMSYGDPSFPPIERVKEIMGKYKKNVSVQKKEHSYSLNRAKKKGKRLHEVLLIGK